MLNSERSNKLIKFSIIIHGSNSRKYLSTVLAIRRNILEILIFKKREHAIFLHSFIRYVAVYTFMHKRFPEKFNPWKMNKNYKISDLYINLTCLSVCLYPINVKMAELIGSNFFWDITRPQGRFLNDKKVCCKGFKAT